MSTPQRSITAFFKPAVAKTSSPPKRLFSVLSNVSTEESSETASQREDGSGDPTPGKMIKLVDSGAVGAITAKPKTKVDPVQLENWSATLRRLVAAAPHALHVNFGPTWVPVLEEEFMKGSFHRLNSFLETERKKSKVYPPPHLVFSWTQFCSVDDVKVVILGQDPYHGEGQAHGLAFSVQKGVQHPPSLVNMFKELSQEYGDSFQKPYHGDLSGWARQGVLLLNASLTVRANFANSHQDKGWEQVTDQVIRWLARNRTGLVFLLWGNSAQRKKGLIEAAMKQQGKKANHRIIETTHPSPLSAHRGFLGSGCFKAVNSFLAANGEKTINWSDL